MLITVGSGSGPQGVAQKKGWKAGGEVVLGMLDGITGRSPQAEVQLPSSPGGFGRSAWKIPEVKIKSKPLESQSSSSFLSPPFLSNT